MAKATTRRNTTTTTTTSKENEVIKQLQAEQNDLRDMMKVLAESQQTTQQMLMGMQGMMRQSGVTSDEPDEPTETTTQRIQRTGIKPAGRSRSQRKATEDISKAWDAIADTMSLVVGPYTKPEWKRTSPEVRAETGERFYKTGKEVTKFGILVTTDNGRQVHQYDLALSDALVVKLARTDALLALADLVQQRAEELKMTPPKESANASQENWKEGAEGSLTF